MMLSAVVQKDFHTPKQKRVGSMSPNLKPFNFKYTKIFLYFQTISRTLTPPFIVSLCFVLFTPRPSLQFPRLRILHYHIMNTLNQPPLTFSINLLQT